MPNVVATVHEQARKSPVAAINWPDRGRAPLGYVEGMAVAFGRVHCRLKAGDVAAAAMAQAMTVIRARMRWPTMSARSRRPVSTTAILAPIR